MTLASERLMLTLAVAAAVAALTADALTLGPVARRMPLAVALPTLAMLAVEIIRCYRVTAPLDPAAPVSRPLAESRAFAWVGVLALLTWVAGMSVGLPGFLLAYLRLHAGERWRLAAGLALALAVLLVGGLEIGLGIRLYRGLAGVWMDGRPS